jgi:lipopolysaccharide biosynthesis glycosyltransferase
MDVAFCFDQQFALVGALAIMSAIRTNPGTRVHAVTEAEGDALRLIRAIADAHGADVRVVGRAPETAHPVDAASDYGTHSTATYRRLFLAELLPQVDRVLYVDADAMVRSNLAPLRDLDLAGATLAAVLDPWTSSLASIQARFPDGYFNAGVLAIDLAAWRNEKTTARCMALVRQAVEAGASELHDQTPLNDAVRGRWRQLSHRWNFTGLHSARLAAELGIAAEEHARVAADPGIVHFLAAYKPWIPGFEGVSRWHAEYDALRREMEGQFDLGSLRWPGAFINSRQVATQRRVMALRLVAAARAAKLERPTVLLTGLLGHEIGLVAREQGFALNRFASESSAMQGGRLLDMPIVAIETALDEGARDFVIGDYRRLPRTRAALVDAAQARGAVIRAIDLDSLRRAA